MKLRNLLLSSALLAGTCLSATAQSFIPPNLDFESGTTANWNYYSGTVATGFIYTMSSVTPSTGHQELMSGSVIDTFGGFPTVGTGSYSLKLNGPFSGYRADAASYNIALPGTGTYSLIYQYAAVLQDPAHMSTHQPVFEVQAIDSTTGTVFFDSIIYDPTPGFTLSTSTVVPGTYYKAWTNVSVDLSAYSGKTVTMKFVAAGCSDGGHFGYAYIDLADLFETYTMLALHATSVTLGGPAGYAAYKWTDAATFTMSYGTTKTVTIPAPAVKTKYALILTPATGHGTVDTVYKTVDIAPTLGAGSLSVATGFTINPNPTSGYMNIRWSNQPTGNADLKITDVTGRTVSQSVLNMDAASGQHQLNLSSLANGTYFVTIKSESIDYSNKIVVQK